MSDKLQKLKLSKLIQEYTFLATDFEYKMEVVEEYKQPFFNDVADKRKDEPEEETPELPPPPPPPIDEENIEEKKKPDPKIKDEVLSDGTKEKIKKIYRDIVKETHPDKIGSEKYIDIYISAKDAYENNDLMELYFICGKLGIEVDPDIEDVIVLEELVTMKRNEIKSIESSFIWVWMNCDTQDKKDRLILEFIKKQTGRG